jgi:hypothetical protein
MMCVSADFCTFSSGNRDVTCCGGIEQRCDCRMAIIHNDAGITCQSYQPLHMSAVLALQVANNAGMQTDPIHNLP